MIKYFLIQHDFNKKESEYIDTYNKYDGLYEMETYAECYIKDKQGEQQISYYKSSDKNRVFGYFIEKDINNVNKLTVKRKYIKYFGIFTNTIVIEDIISFSLVEYIDDDFYEYNIERNDFEYKEIFDKVIKSIKLIEE